MRTIVAIGGGIMKRGETTTIDTAIVKMTHKKHPKALLIPTASKDSKERYRAPFAKQYGDDLGCEVSELLLLNTPSQKEIEQAILQTDIIYVGGGNTCFMQEVWEKMGVLPLLKQAYENGVILAGLSAGANCWFEKSSTDSFLTEEDKKDFHKAKEKLAIIDDLGYLKGVCCPHYLKEAYRRPAFLYQLCHMDTSVAYGIDEGAALVFINEKLQGVLGEGKAFKIKSENGVFTEKEIPKCSFS